MKMNKVVRTLAFPLLLGAAYPFLPSVFATDAPAPSAAPAPATDSPPPASAPAPVAAPVPAAAPAAQAGASTPSTTSQESASTAPAPAAAGGTASSPAPAAPAATESATTAEGAATHQSAPATPATMESVERSLQEMQANQKAMNENLKAIGDSITEAQKRLQVLQDATLPSDSVDPVKATAVKPLPDAGAAPFADSYDEDEWSERPAPRRQKSGPSGDSRYDKGGSERQSSGFSQGGRRPPQGRDRAQDTRRWDSEDWNDQRNGPPRRRNASSEGYGRGGTGGRGRSW